MIVVQKYKTLLITLIIGTSLGLNWQQTISEPVRTKFYNAICHNITVLQQNVFCAIQYIQYTIFYTFL